MRIPPTGSHRQMIVPIPRAGDTTGRRREDPAPDGAAAARSGAGTTLPPARSLVPIPLAASRADALQAARAYGATSAVSRLFPAGTMMRIAV